MVPFVDELRREIADLESVRNGSVAAALRALLAKYHANSLSSVGNRQEEELLRYLRTLIQYLRSRASREHIKSMTNWVNYYASLSPPSRVRRAALCGS